jgi:hypothetical protein
MEATASWCEVDNFGFGHAIIDPTLPVKRKRMAFNVIPGNHELSLLLYSAYPAYPCDYITYYDKNYLLNSMKLPQQIIQQRADISTLID